MMALGVATGYMQRYPCTAHACLQVLAALYALAELLRLQVLWGPSSVLVPDGYNTALFCRIFTAVTFGFLEPSFLLLALFSCVYSVQVRGRVPSAAMCGSVLDEIQYTTGGQTISGFDMQGRSSSDHPNSNIVFFSLGLSLPFCAAQVVCAGGYMGGGSAGRVLIVISTEFPAKGRCGKRLLPCSTNALDKVLGAAPGSGYSRDNCLGFGRLPPSVGSGALLFAFTNASPRLALSQPAAHLPDCPILCLPCTGPHFSLPALCLLPWSPRCPSHPES